MFVFFENPAFAIVVGYSMTDHGVNEAREGLLSNESTSVKQAQEHVLYHVLCQLDICRSHHDELD